MKKLVLPAAVAACCILFSCNNSGGGGNDKNLEVTHDIYKGLETGDTSKLVNIADDGVDHMGPNGTEVKGGENIRKMLADMHNHVKDLKIDVMQEAANGDYVFVLSKLTGTATDNMMGQQPGTAISQTAVDVIKFKDGKAVEHWGFMDPNEMMKMMQQQKPMDNMKTDTTKMKKDSM